MDFEFPVSSDRRCLVPVLRLGIEKSQQSHSIENFYLFEQAPLKLSCGFGCQRVLLWLLLSAFVVLVAGSTGSRRRINSNPGSDGEKCQHEWTAGQ